MRNLIFILAFLTAIDAFAAGGIPADAFPALSMSKFDDAFLCNVHVSDLRQQAIVGLDFRCREVYVDIKVVSDGHSYRTVTAQSYCVPRLPSEMAYMSLAKACIQNWNEACSNPDNIKAMNSVSPTKYYEVHEGECK